MKITPFFSLEKATTWSFYCLLVLFVAACNDDDGLGYINLTPDYCNRTNLDCDIYLPYKIGNYWLADDGYKSEVTGTTVINSKVYYIISLYDETGELVDDFYERAESGKLFSKGNDTNKEDGLYANFIVEPETVWGTTHHLGGTIEVVLESKATEITINGVTLGDAYSFGWTFSDALDKFERLIFLPGIGLVADDVYVNGVKQESSWKIIEFKIDDKVYKIK